VGTKCTPFRLTENQGRRGEVKSHDWFVPLFTPENVMEIQRTIGADIIMAFDECTPYPCDYRYAQRQ
jgi:tRNA-guanine family transglycosylase